jgi:hypothetical protein
MATIGGPTSTAELISLEREVEVTRERVAGDLARLRSPATLSEFKRELWTEARESKDQIVESATNYVEDTVQNVLSDIKGRAAANPAAALAIGAGCKRMCDRSLRGSRCARGSIGAPGPKSPRRS